METAEMITHLLIGPLLLVLSFIFLYFPPKTINPLYGHRTTLSMKNQDTWNEANRRSSLMMILVSAATCILQLFGIVFHYDSGNTILTATIFLVVGLVVGILVVEKQLRSVFDKEGNRK